MSEIGLNLTTGMDIVMTTISYAFGVLAGWLMWGLKLRTARKGLEDLYAQLLAIKKKREQEADGRIKIVKELLDRPIEVNPKRGMGKINEN